MTIPDVFVDEYRRIRLGVIGTVRAHKRRPRRWFRRPRPDQTVL